MKEQDQEFIEYVVKQLVDQPNDVSTDRSVDEMGVLITLKVNPEDLGQVIGRQGQTAKAIRTLLRVVGARNHARVNLKIFEPEGYRKANLKQRTEGAAPAEQKPEAPLADPTDVDDLKL
ncbi:MAG: KH domain-containing protein [Candidatus Kerfeldbacteria bacterium]|nr:KH domain-containing protein [Candidatus Kerfeldbacteria bacterium]